jgi:hypothetical protein
MNITVNAASFIKILKTNNYSQRQVCIITGANKDFVSRIWRGLSFQYVKESDYVFYDKWEKNRSILDLLLTAPEIAGSGSLTLVDKAYIRLLKYCGVNYERVKQIYSDRSLRELRNIWSLGTEIKLKWFDPYLLDIEELDYLNFIST